MKRCPQCEFIYEDDQSRCDMDGIDLVFDNPTPSLTSPQPAPRAKRNISRRSVLSICGVVLGVLVFAIGFASLERAFSVSSEPDIPPQASVSQTVTQEEIVPKTPVEPVDPVAEDPTVTMVSNTAKASHVAASEPARDPASKSAAEPLQRNSLGTRGMVVGSVPKQNRIDAARSQPGMIRPTTPPPAKKDSKVVTIVKKAGRILKKPF